MTDWTIRTATDDDWPAIALLDAVGFGVFIHPQRVAALRSMTPPEAVVVACDDRVGVVGVAMHLDLRLTVPGAALPAAGITGVVVAPTHRRRGILRAMYVELHRRIAAQRYPVAALTASEGGLYGRFGYGPATVKHALRVDRRSAALHSDVPDPGGVRLIRPGEHSAEFADIYRRWARDTPGGLVRPQPLFDDLLADREDTRGGGTPWLGLLHADGYVLYRVHGTDPKTVRVGEFRAVDDTARIALWRALLGLDLMTHIEIDTHPEDPLPYLLTDPRLVQDGGRRDELWLRLMDVPAALTARSYVGDLEVVIEVRDGFRCDGGRFGLRVRDGVADCAPTAAAADLVVDLDVLGSLYLGTHRAVTLARAGRLRCDSAGLPRRLDAALAVETPAQLGFFF